MICEKCHKERKRGDTYLFYYGNKGRSSTTYDINQMQKVTSTTYTIAGQSGAQICNLCVLRVQILYLMLTGILPLFAFFAAYTGYSQGFTANTVVCGGIGIILIIALPILTYKEKQMFGENVAISVHKKALKAQKFNAFLTTGAFKRMRKEY